MTSKEFVKAVVPFSCLKRMGFFTKDTKFNEYEKITQRYLHYFGYKTVEDYLKENPVPQ